MGGGALLLRSEDNLLESVLSFHHVRARGGSQVATLGGRHLYLLGYLARLR